MSKQRIYKIIFGLLFLLISYAIINLANNQQQQIQKQSLDQQTTPAISITKIPTTTLPPLLVSSPSSIRKSPLGVPAKVNRVIDGDTIEVIVNGQKKKVRLIGINTPETVDPRKPVQCFGNEASLYAKQLLTNKSIYLESDPTQGNGDKYHRLLRYIWLDTKTNVNQLLIADGYAYEYTYDIPYKYQTEFKAAQHDAEDAGRGLWAANTCRGKK